MALDDVAREHYRGRRGLADAIARLARQIWSRIDPGNLSESWDRYGPELVIGLAGVQLAAARQADDYTDEALAAQGVDPAGDRVNPRALAGVASDGRPLDSLLLNAITTVKTGIAGGVGIDQAMAGGYANLNMLVQTQVADAGRNADQLAIVGRDVDLGYVRMVQAGACGRCIVLAGRFYRWNAGFLRHPACHCTHVPAAEDRPGDIRTDPKAWFESLSKAEQDKAFTNAGAQAIRDGADIGQVVNARRGAFGLATGAGRLQTRRVFGQDLFTTTEGAGRAPRLMPESIYKIAGNDRDEAIRLLRRHGYLRDAPVRPRPLDASRASRPTPVPTQRAVATPPPAPPRRTLQQAVASGVRSREKLTGGLVAETSLVTFNDGSKAIVKLAKDIGRLTARQQQDAEELGALVTAAVGLKAPQVYRSGPDELFMEFMPGRTAVALAQQGSVFGLPPGAYNDDEMWLLGLADQAIFNYDRHKGNWLIEDDGTIHPLDHGLAFTNISFMRPSRGIPVTTDFAQPAERFARRVNDVGEWIDNDMSPADVALARARVKGLRPDFQRLGHLDWYEDALERLQQIERHAKGTKRRIR